MRIVRLNSKGDTIIEVLIVLTILSFAFAIASATSTGSLTRSRNSQEHSQALGLLNSQIELLRKAIDYGDPKLQAAQPFCLVGVSVTPINSSVNLQNPDAYPQCKSGSYYGQNIKYVPAAGSTPAYYELAINWDGAGSLGKQRELMYYRISKFDNQSPGVSAIANKVTVVAKSVVPVDTNSTANCSQKQNAAPLPGATISLSDGTNTLTNATGASSVEFTDNIRNGVTYTGGISLPAGFTSLCAPTSPTTSLGADGTALMTFYAVPQVQSLYGGQYSSCDRREYWGDGSDECFKLGNSMFAYRNVNITYPLSLNSGRKVHLRFNYQNNGAYPRNYSYNLNVTVGGVTQTISLPATAGAVDSDVFELTVPAGSPNLQVLWTNNAEASGADANLQINKVQMYY